MPAERYFFEGDLSPNRSIEISGTEFHHLARVMRAKKGDEVELVDGKGNLAIASVQELLKERAKLQIQTLETTTERPFQLILAQAFCKQNRMDLILEKCTELGINQFWLFPGEHSDNKECYPNQKDRNQTITISALKQSGRLFLPEIAYKAKIANWIKNDGITIFFGDLDVSAPSFESLFKRPLEKHCIVFVIGPEGGFSQKEIIALKSLGAQGVKLHPNILRTETASIMAVSLISHFAFYKTTPL